MAPAVVDLDLHKFVAIRSLQARPPFQYRSAHAFPSDTDCPTLSLSIRSVQRTPFRCLVLPAEQSHRLISAQTQTATILHVTLHTETPHVERPFASSNDILVCNFISGPVYTRLKLRLNSIRHATAHMNRLESASMQLTAFWGQIAPLSFPQWSGLQSPLPLHHHGLSCTSIAHLSMQLTFSRPYLHITTACYAPV